ncbi:GNAT family N-acetyltransferase [Klebsiella sp. BIGb0407]|uniref:GNAT family N-acetyltransferase n=1 Tax=Klebsiella sp. BIGb0407 TaxID=2940603 RepID=UPI00286E9D00|nr:GNAT family N-acetyltransferase [Klebsiella sp. BIGb0407]MCS3429956.1 RimJ/RimL family protein N-acetyltransferase [Klebsiella sp. BIGb0407]
MSLIINEFQQPIGLPLPNWQPCGLPQRITLEGRYCRLEALDVARHGNALWEAWQQAPDNSGWTYLSIGPFSTRDDFIDYLNQAAGCQDPFHFAVVDNDSGQATGTLSLMRIDHKSGTIEEGWVVFSPLLQRSVQATEAHFLLMKYAFETLGYRRYEWKCDSLNAPSRRAALRLGFRYEGLFRNAVIYKQRTRDTAWFSIIADEWPRIKAGFEAWLAADNMAHGIQKVSLSKLRDTPGAPTALAGHLTVRLLNAGDLLQWQGLWQGYLTFYESDLPASLSTLTWERLLDPSELIKGMAAFDEKGIMLGFTHFVYHRSSWSATYYCYLEDLFTAPDARGKGVARALIEAVRIQAMADNCSRLYWHTHENNTRAQALYDRVATQSGFIQYRKGL